MNIKVLNQNSYVTGNKVVVNTINEISNLDQYRVLCKKTQNIDRSTILNCLSLYLKEEYDSLDNALVSILFTIKLAKSNKGYRLLLLTLITKALDVSYPENIKDYNNFFVITSDLKIEQSTVFHKDIPSFRFEEQAKFALQVLNTFLQDE